MFKQTKIPTYCVSQWCLESNFRCNFVFVFLSLFAVLILNSAVFNELCKTKTIAEENHKNRDSSVNQSNLYKANICSWCKARENVCESRLDFGVLLLIGLQSDVSFLSQSLCTFLFALFQDRVVVHFGRKGPAHNSNLVWAALEHGKDAGILLLHQNFQASTHTRKYQVGDLWVWPD